MIDEDGSEFPESYLDLPEYQKESEFLLLKIAEREEMAQLLKIAKPEKIADIRELITRLDDVIERTEILLELYKKLHSEKVNYLTGLENLVDMSDKIEIELRKYVAEKEPEKLELIEAILSGDDKTH